MRFLSILFYLCCSLLYYEYTNIKFNVIFVSSITPGIISLGNIGNKDLSQNMTRSNMNVGRKGF